MPAPRVCAPLFAQHALLEIYVTPNSRPLPPALRCLFEIILPAEVLARGICSARVLRDERARLPRSAIRHILPRSAAV